jgi:hypothetical protein
VAALQVEKELAVKVFLWRFPFSLSVETTTIMSLDISLSLFV